MRNPERFAQLDLNLARKPKLITWRTGALILNSGNPSFLSTLDNCREQWNSIPQGGGVCRHIYSPLGWIRAVGSNWLHVGLRWILNGGVGRLQKGGDKTLGGTLPGPCDGKPAPPVRGGGPACFLRVVDPSLVPMTCASSAAKFCGFYTLKSLFNLIPRIIPEKIHNHQNLWNLSVKSLFYY